MDQGTGPVGHDVGYSVWADLLEIHDPGSGQGGLSAQPGKPRRQRVTGASLAGVLYLAAPGTPLGSPGGALQPSPGWAVGWYPDRSTRWLGVQEFAAQIDEISRIDIDGSQVRLDLGSGEVIDLFVVDGGPLMDAILATPLGTLLTGPSAWGAGRTPDAFTARPAYQPFAFPPADDHDARPSPSFRAHFRRHRAQRTILSTTVCAVLGFSLTLLMVLSDRSSRGSSGPVVAPGEILGRPPGYSGPAYPRMITQDRVANSAGQVQLFGATITASNLRPAPPFGGPLMCADAIIENRSTDRYSYSSLDWSLIKLDGSEQPATLDGTITAGVLSPGQAVKGTVCFHQPAQHGTFVVVWNAFLPRVERGVWRLNLEAR